MCLYIYYTWRFIKRKIIYIIYQNLNTIRCALFILLEFFLCSWLKKTNASFILKRAWVFVWFFLFSPQFVFEEVPMTMCDDNGIRDTARVCRHMRMLDSCSCMKTIKALHEQEVLPLFKQSEKYVLMIIRAIHIDDRQNGIE